MAEPPVPRVSLAPFALFALDGCPAAHPIGGDGVDRAAVEGARVVEAAEEGEGAVVGHRVEVGPVLVDDGEGRDRAGHGRVAVGVVVELRVFEEEGEGAEPAVARDRGRRDVVEGGLAVLVPAAEDVEQAAEGQAPV